MNNLKQKFILKIILTIVFILFLSQNLYAVKKEVVVVVHKNNPISNILSVELRRLWLGKIDEIEGVELQPISSEKQIACKIVFYKSILNKSRKGLRKYYIREELKGVFKKPKSVKTIQLLLTEITTDSTTICFIDKKDLPDTLEFKILTVDGMHSSDKNYKIK